MSKHFMTQNLKLFTAACFGLCLFISLAAKPVQASATADHQIDVQLRADLSAVVSTETVITNNDGTGRVLNTWKVTFPFNNVANYTVTYNDIPAEFYWQSLGNAHELTVRLGGQSIKPGTVGVFKVNFTTNDAVAQSGSYKLFEFPEQTFDYTVASSEINISYPAEWGAQLFSSAEVNAAASRLTASRSGGVFAFWLPEMVDLRVVQSMSVGDIPTAVNLIPNLPGQSVAYPKVSGLSAAGVDAWGNIWGVTNQDEVNLAADVQLTPAAVTVSADASCKLVTWPDDQFRQASTAELIREASNFLHQTFTLPVSEDAIAQFTPEQLRLKWEQKQTLTSVERICAISSLLSARGIPHAISYGYYALPGGKFYQFAAPTYWLEIDGGDGRLVFDPQFEQAYGGGGATGAGISHVPDQARLIMGYWHPDNVYARNFSEIPAPKLTSNPFPGLSGSVELELSAPKVAYSGEFYVVPLRIHSRANHIIPIERLLVNSQDYTNQAVNLAPGLRKALLPESTTDLVLEYLREPNFLYAGEKELQVELSLATDVSPLVTASDRTRFIVDTGLLAVLAGGSVLTTLVLLITFGRSLLWPHFRRQQLRRQYLRQRLDPVRSQTGSRGKPKVLSKSVENDVIRFGDM
jgi:hypothetical protein